MLVFKPDVTDNGEKKIVKDNRGNQDLFYKTLKMLRGAKNENSNKKCGKCKAVTIWAIL